MEDREAGLAAQRAERAKNDRMSGASCLSLILAYLWMMLRHMKSTKEKKNPLLMNRSWAVTITVQLFRKLA